MIASNLCHHDEKRDLKGRNEIRIITNWNALENNEMTGLSLGCSYFVLNVEQLQPYHNDNENSRFHYNFQLSKGMDVL